MDLTITPKSLVLSMLQASRNQTMPVKTLVLIGGMFGFTGNTIRVQTARLLREGTIVRDKRGLYCLSQKAERVSRYIDRWKKGEGRLRKWNGKWLCCIVPGVTGKRLVELNRRFDLFGFREGLPGLWVRPDNLSMSFNELKKLLFQVGKIAQGEVFVADRFSDQLTERWKQNIWQVEALVEKQASLLKRMGKSMHDLENIPLENALPESYLLGSEAIQLLIMDPLLPPEIMNSRTRIRLTQMMMIYDELGKEIWSRQFDRILIDQSPTHLQMMGKAI